MKVSLGIVTYRSDLDVLSELLQALAAGLHSLAADVLLTGEVLVVSNDEGSVADSGLAACLDSARCALPAGSSVTLIEGHGNVGYGAGQNLALRRTRSDFHLILNPDVVPEADAVAASVRYLVEHPETVMVVPQGFDAGGRYARLAKRDPSVLTLGLRALSVPPSSGWFGRRVARYTYADRLPADEPMAVRLGSGCFMCCRTPALHAVGGFDERYFLYFEDYDLSRRLADMGEIHEVPWVRIHHFGGRTAHRGLRRISHFAASAVRYFNAYGWSWM